MEDFKKELKDNWVRGLKDIDKEMEELRKEESKCDIPCRIWKWLSRK